MEADLSDSDERPGTPVDERTSRLAEMVTGLTGCPPTGALHVLRTDDEPAHDALELVARAMVRVDAPPDPHLRVGGHLRGEPAEPAAAPDSATGMADPSSGPDRLRPPRWVDSPPNAPPGSGVHRRDPG